MNICPFCNSRRVTGGPLRRIASGIDIYEWCGNCLSSWRTSIEYGRSPEAQRIRNHPSVAP